MQKMVWGHTASPELGFCLVVYWQIFLLKGLRFPAAPTFLLLSFCLQHSDGVNMSEALFGKQKSMRCLAANNWRLQDVSHLLYLSHFSELTLPGKLALCKHSESDFSHPPTARSEVGGWK